MTVTVVAQLSDVAKFVRGITFKPDDVVPVGTLGSAACMRTKNVQANLDLSNVWGVPDSFVKRDDQYLLAGDILVSTANSWNLVGKCCCVPTLPWRSTFGGFISVLRPDLTKIDPRYLFRWFASDRTQATVRSFGQQTTNISNLNINRCRKLLLLLPPLSEQRRIGEILDRADALRAKRRAAIAQLDTLTQAIFLDMFGDPATNPKGWRTERLGDIADFVGGGTPSRARAEFYEGPICWATSKDMKCEFLDVTQEHVTEQAIAESATKVVPPGTILLVVKSKILAHSLPVAISRVPVCFGQDLKGIRISARCEVAFVATLLRLGKRWLLERARGINTEGLTLDHLKSFPILVPPIASQREFGRRKVLIDELKSGHQGSLAQLGALFASLQHRAFRGEL